MSGDGPDYVLGFLLASFAGLATVIGMLFVPLTRSGLVSQDGATAAALGFAAGVMMWVAFVDVLGAEAVSFFNNHYAGAEGEHDKEVQVRLWVFLFFFIGMILTMLLDKVVGDQLPIPPVSEAGVAMTGREVNGQGDAEAANPAEIGENEEPKSKANLARISLVSMIALTAHNFPEGLATFFDSANGGLTVVIAIGLHNIPEGAAIAIPTFQNTGSYMSAFKATLIAGLAQPIGALLGWFLIAVAGSGYDLPFFLYGALYSGTAGVMIGISLVGLLPEAFALKPPAFVGLSVIAGFVLMEISIISLTLAGL